MVNQNPKTETLKSKVKNNKPLKKLGLLKKTRPDINRVAPVTQINLDNGGGFGVRFTRLIHHLSRARTYPGPGPGLISVHGQRRVPRASQLKGTRGNERGAERDGVGGLSPKEEVGRRLCGGFGGERSAEMVGGGSHGWV